MRLLWLFQTQHDSTFDAWVGPIFSEIKGSLWQPKQPSLISREEVGRVERMVSGKAIRTQSTTTTFQIFKDGLKSPCNFFSLRLKCIQFLHPILLPCFGWPPIYGSSVCLELPNVPGIIMQCSRTISCGQTLHFPFMQLAFVAVFLWAGSYSVCGQFFSFIETVHKSYLLSGIYVIDLKKKRKEKPKLSL